MFCEQLPADLYCERVGHGGQMRKMVWEERGREEKVRPFICKGECLYSITVKANSILNPIISDVTLVLLFQAPRISSCLLRFVIGK